MSLTSTFLTFKKGCTTCPNWGGNRSLGNLASHFYLFYLPIKPSTYYSSDASYQSCENLHLKLLPLFAEKVSLVDNAMEVMLPSGNPVPANGCLWEGTSSPQLEVSDRTSAAICCNSTLVTRGPGTDVKIPGEEMVGRGGTERRSTTGRRSGSPRAMPLLSVASLSASFHTDTTMSRWPRQKCCKSSTHIPAKRTPNQCNKSFQGGGLSKVLT